MPVFLSHRRADTALAARIDTRLKQFGIKTYLDVLDPVLSNAENVTNRIVSGLKSCTHLLAIVSTVTNESWWVGFEIGVASENEKRITSYCRGLVELPDYLKIWPVLTRDSQIDQFATAYLKDARVLEKSIQSYSESRKTPIQEAADFHRTLKRALGQ